MKSMHSNIFPKIASKLIDLDFFSKLLSSFLCPGTTLALFQQLGKVPSCNDASNISFKGR